MSKAMRQSKPRPERVIMIDDDLHEAQNHIDLLNSNPGAEALQFILVSPEEFSEMNAYLKLIRETGASAIIIDQRLGEQSGARYSGLELADKLRNPLPYFPIFILTKYFQNDLEIQGAALDDIMDKRDFYKKSGIYLSRLLRAVGRYNEAASRQRQRLDGLMRKAFHGELSDAEKDEVDGLRVELLWLTIDDDIKVSGDLQQQIDLRSAFLEELKKIKNN